MEAKWDSVRENLLFLEVASITDENVQMREANC